MFARRQPIFFAALSWMPAIRRRVDHMDWCVADRLKEISALAVIAPCGFGEVLVVLGLKVGLDQPAKCPGLRGFGSLRLGDGTDRFALGKELGGTNGRAGQGQPCGRFRGDSIAACRAGP